MRSIFLPGLRKTGDLIDGVRPSQWVLATPCPDYDVRTLVNHIVGWLQVFEAGCHDRTVAGDTAAYECGPDPAQEFRTAADSLVAGWQKFGLDRQVRVTSGYMPGLMVFNMTVMEYLTHGWDLATATEQPIPYTDEEAEAVLARAEVTLPAEYRGPGMPFDAIVEVPPDAPPVERVVAFLGRRVPS